MVDTLRIKSFSHYYVPLLLQSSSTYLLDPNFDEDSFGGEGKILGTYVISQTDGIFLISKALHEVAEKLPNFVLNRTKRQVVGNAKATRGMSLFEFSPDLDNYAFDSLFRTSFYNGGISSTKELGRNVPHWKEFVLPRIRKNKSVFMFFMALGEQLAIFGPEPKIGELQMRAKELSCEWSDLHTFFDDA